MKHTKNRIYQALHLGLVAILVSIGSAHPLFSDDVEEDKTLDTSSFESYSGFFDFFWDDAEAKIWLRLSEPDQEIHSDPFLYVSSLATGLGSNPVGLDRGQLGSDRMVRFRRVGNQVFLIQENLKFRALTDNQQEQRAVRESFAESVLWSGTLKESDVGKLVDITDFLLRDAHDCVGTLNATDQGSYTLDAKRSFIHLPRTKAFPKNSEFEASLTFQCSEPGRLASRVAADGDAVTLRQHHSFVQLPEPGYKPRQWDPRVGAFALRFSDYGSGIEEPLEKRWITRHRLERVDPAAESGPVKEPIVYYLDPGVPEPVRSALLEGARWWSEAFEEAGFEDAFQVRVLPADADPMDIRYNVIQWVHRATRGWSYGQSFVDPRTGEIIKGHVLLGSLRVRQDHLLFEGMSAASPVAQSGQRAATCGMASTGQELYLSQLDPSLSSTEVALARIRQLSAHEVGHTLGFAHNFAASTYGDRASVMDYPSPRVKITDAKLDLSDAYGVGIGSWDKFTVKYAYAQYPAEQEAAALQGLIQQAIEEGMIYVTDADARPAGAAQPFGNLWDNGTDPVQALKHEMQVRELALAEFNASALHPTQPLADLEKTLVPVYLHHRYQVDATAKMLGGFRYSYALPEDGQIVLEALDPDEQLKAFEALLETLDPATLALPTEIIAMIPPKASSSVADNERFDSRTSPLFDPASAVESAAQLTLANLLEPHRASRLVRQGQDHPQIGLTAVLERVAEQLRGQVDRDAASGQREARRIVERIFIDQVQKLATSKACSTDARNVARQFLEDWSDIDNGAGARLDSVQWRSLKREIKRFLDRPFPATDYNAPPSLPPGSPIGQ